PPSLHDALPISQQLLLQHDGGVLQQHQQGDGLPRALVLAGEDERPLRQVFPPPHLVANTGQFLRRAQHAPRPEGGHAAYFRAVQPHHQQARQTNQQRPQQNEQVQQNRPQESQIKAPSKRMLSKRTLYFTYSPSRPVMLIGPSTGLGRISASGSAARNSSMARGMW